MNKIIKWGTVAGYLATVPVANWFINNVGTQSFPNGPHTIPVGFGYSAPSGVLLIGVGLALRDLVQRLAGRTVMLIAMVVGTILSYIVNPVLATASAIAFICGELFDFFVFSSIKKKNLYAAICLSGIAGAIVDTFVFLPIAFGSTAFWQGQIIGKTLVAGVAALVVWGWNAVSLRLSA